MQNRWVGLDCFQLAEAITSAIKSESYEKEEDEEVGDNEEEKKEEEAKD